MPNPGVTFDNAINRGGTPGLMNASLDGVPFRLNPDSVSLSFNVKTSTTPTVGGLVVQVFGVEFSDLVVSGSFGRGGWKEQKAFLDRMLAMAQRQGTQPITSPQPLPVRFLFPSRGYDFQVYLKGYTSGDGMAVVHDNMIINPTWTLTMFIETEHLKAGDPRDSLTKIAADAYIDRLATGLGYALSEYNGPLTTSDVQNFLTSQGQTSLLSYVNSEMFSMPVQQQAAVTPGTSATGTATGTTNPIPGDVTVTDNASFATNLLGALGAPNTQANIDSLVHWQLKESKFGSGGPDDPLVTHNPLNCTVTMPGSHGINSVNVQSYVSWKDGLQATVDTLTGGRHYYDDIVAALRTGSGLGNGHYKGLMTWSGNGYDHI